MGIFKRFRASMTFGIDAVEQTVTSSTQPAVYRPFATESIYSPGYRVIEEGSVNSSNSNQQIVNKNKTQRPKSTPTIQAQSGLSNGQAQLPSNSTEVLNVRPGPSETSSKSNTDKKEKDKKKEKSKEKRKENSKDEKKKKEKQKVMVGEQNESKSKSKDKEKPKKDKGKKEKDNAKVKQTNKTEPKQLASVTLNEVPVAPSEDIKTKNGTLPPPPYTEEDVITKTNVSKSRNVLANPLAATTARANIQTETDLPATNSGFSSSWDQVAMHRQNLHRELQSFKPQQNNLRSMMNRDKVDEVGKETTTRFTPSNNSPRNITSTNYSSHNNSSKRYSNSSGSEADA